MAGTNQGAQIFVVSGGKGGAQGPRTFFGAGAGAGVGRHMFSSVGGPRTVLAEVEENANAIFECCFVNFANTGLAKHGFRKP